MCEFCEAKWAGGTWGSPGGEVTWRFAEVGEGDGDVVGEMTGGHAARTREAFDAWESVIDIDFVEAAPGEDADILLGWGDVDGPYGVIGYARTLYLGDTLVGSSIIMDAADRWSENRGHVSNAARGEWNFYAVIAHEIGHAIGLPHLEEQTSLMHATSLQATDLTLADVRAAVQLYGPARTPGRVGDDVLAGRDGDDVLRGGGGDDVLHAFGGADRLNGGRGSDRLRGGDGDDALRGGAGRDHLVGGRDVDSLQGGAGRDRLKGQHGDDRLDGGPGRDVLRGGGGADVFVFSAGGGRDVVRDWTDGSDRLELAGGGRFRELDVRRIGDDVVLRWKGAEMVLEDAADDPFNGFDLIA